MNFIQKLLVKAASGVTRNLKLNQRFVRWPWNKYTFSQAVTDGYQANSAVFACVSALAFSFPEAPLLAGTETDGKFKANYRDELMKIIRQPNPDMGEAEFMQFVVVYAAIGGNVYIWKQRNKNGQVLHWWPFSDAQMTPVRGESTAQGFVKEYLYDPGNGGEKLRLSKDDIIHWKWMPDPLHPEKGMGAIMAAAREVDKDSEANAYIYALLKNNAVPPIVITLTEDDELTPDKAKRLRKEWTASHAGENAGTPAFLEAGMTVEKLGFDLQQLAAETLSAVPEARIAACFRVPPVVAGLSVGLKRSDYGDQAARRSFTELTLAALWRSFASELWSGMKDEIPVKAKNWAVQFNLRVVRALQEDETKIWERVTSAFERSLLTRAQAKIQLGIEPDDGDEVYKVSLASEFVPAGQAVVREEAAVEKGKGVNTKDAKDAKESKAKNAGTALRKLRAKLAVKMEAELEKYFSDLAEKVVARAKKTKNDPYPPALSPNPKAGFGESELKTALPDAEDLLSNEDEAALIVLITRFYVTMMELSWESWNLSLGVETAFDLTDPLVTRVLAGAGKQVREIQQTTLEALKELLQYGNENGWSIDELVRGDPANGVRGLREIVEQTYKGRARTIARTELGTAQNSASVERYEGAGVSKVIIMDNGAEDDDDACKIANGQIWSLAYFEEHLLEHPNCTRAAGAYFGERAPVRE
jgi:HK97 family phage portal protein